MYNIKDGELLIRTKKFELLRSDGRIQIIVSDRIHGKSHHKFMAYPEGFVGRPEDGYCGFGLSGDEALRGLLNAIKEVSTKDVIESVSKKTPTGP